MALAEILKVFGLLLRKSQTIRTLFLLGVILRLGGAGGLQAQTYDCILRHGRIVDGTGNPAFSADVGIHAGHIVAVGRIIGSVPKEIDATGLVIAPGFIDVHTHADDLAERPEAENFVRMGVTSIVAGNCGSSAPDIGRLFHQVESNGISLNFATLVGHGTVRERAMGGSFDRPPSPNELAVMKGMVAKAMGEGAVGLSTGLIYLPGAFAKSDEIIELARVASAFDGIYVSHMRNEGDKITEAMAEVFAVARSAQIRAQISHIKLSGRANWGHPEAVLALIDAARSEGLDITQDEYLYTASSTGLSQLVPENAREGDKLKERLADPREKAAIIAEMKSRLKRGRRKDYSYVVISICQHDPSLNGLSIPDAAKKVRGSASLGNQIELILDLEWHGGATAVFHGISEEDLQLFLRHPNTMIASDSGVRRLNQGWPHPRGYGNNARLLARYVRDLKLLRLEDAIRRMTSLPASVYHFSDRGVIRPGAWADLVVFDPKRVQDQATFDDPHHYATGFAWVFVNGVAVVENDRHTGARPGMVLRHTSGEGNPVRGMK